MDDFQHLDDHALLGVLPGAPRDEIKQAYRREITKYHPDWYRNADLHKQQYARERSRRLTEAYAALSRTTRQQPGTISRSPVGGAPMSPSGGVFSRPTTGARMAARYEQARRLLAGGRAGEALQLLRQIQRADPFYRDVDELVAQAERRERGQASSARPRRRPIVAAGAGMLGLLVLLAGAWGARGFQTAASAQTPPCPTHVAAAVPPTAASGTAPVAVASACRSMRIESR